MASALLIMVFGFVVFQQCEGDANLGSQLNAGQPNQTWLTSANGMFSIGFRDAPNSAGNLYNLAIWHEKSKTIVWRAMNNDSGGVPVSVDESSRVVLKLDGRLALDSDSAGILWGTSTSNLGVVRAAMRDDGNLVLLSSTGDGIWQSFEHPTDTLLPNQQFTGSTRLVSSNQRYYLAMDRSEVALYFQGYWLEPYWRMKNSNIGQATKNIPPRLNFTSNGMLIFYDGNGNSWSRPTAVLGLINDTSQRYASDYGTASLRRLKLDDDGNLRIYSLAAEESWSRITWQAVLLECDIFGKCGRFGICTYRPTATCTCPPGFHPTNVTDMSHDCAYDTPLPKCRTVSNSTFAAPNSTKAIVLDRTDYQYNDYNINPLPEPTSEEECKTACLNDCQCLGAAYKVGGYGMCWRKGLDPSGLYNGKQSLDVGNVFFLKVSSEEPAQSPPSNIYVTNANATVVPGFKWLTAPPSASLFSDSVRVGLFSVAIIELVLLLGETAFACYLLWLNKALHVIVNDDLGFEGGPTRFSYQQLQAATNNFTQKLGSGGFGTVYKGVLPDKTTVVAVKEIEMATQAETQFQAEVKTIGKIHHINLVRLLGYCSEGRHKLLVYEYMPNGSLEKRLFLEDTKFFCDWNSRFNIALGIARGITYLHEECRECILHCDIKPQNILLDEEFCPKVADFGLARLLRRESAFVVTTVRGTRGYLAPEWLSNLSVTTKADVYSFGMMLLEILSGRDKFTFTLSALGSESERWYFPIWAFKKYKAEDLYNIADKKLGGHVDWVQFERLLKIAFWCIQLDANARPSMGKVVQMLKDNIQVPEPPFPKLHEDDTKEQLVATATSSSIAG